MTHEISHEITEDDLLLYERMGYNKHALGFLQSVEDENYSPYTCWEDLASHRSPWGEFLASPNNWFEFLVSIGTEIPGNFEYWLLFENNRRLSTLNQINNAESLDLSSSISVQRIDPQKIIRIVDRPVNQPIRRIGEIVGALDLSHEFLLELANTKAWGKEGGFQLIADVVKKPVIVNAEFNLKQDFFPRLK